MLISRLPRIGMLWLSCIVLLLVSGEQATAAGDAVADTGAATVLPAQRDASVQQSRPTANYGGVHLAVGPGARAFVGFDLAAIPSGATVERAVLRLKPFRIPTDGNVVVTLGRAEGTWAENRLTWDNQPTITPRGPQATVSDLDWVEWTVTEPVRDWLGGRVANHGFGLYTANPGQGLLFHSRETGPAPELVVFIQSDDTPGELALTLDVDTGAGPVRNGDAISYIVQLHHHGGQEATQADLRFVLPAQAYLAPGVYVEEVSFRAEPLAVRVGYEQTRDGDTVQVITWRGTLSPDAGIKITIPAYVRAACQQGVASIPVDGEASARAPGGDVLRAGAQFQVTCPQTSVDDIEVSLNLVGARRISTDADEALMLGGPDTATRGVLQASLTNNENLTVIVFFQVGTRYIGETEKNLLPTQVLLRPGETRVVELPLDTAELLQRIVGLPDTPDVAAAGVDDDGELQVEYSFTYGVMPYIDTRQLLDQRERIPLATKKLRLRLRAWDVGDAPDSANHFGVAMTAYANGTTARYPTVFDSPTLPPGPAHVAPRFFHLGRAVSPEPDADLGPSPNLHPPSDTPDRDLYDDGAAPATWALAHCQTTTIAVRLFISPQAATWFQQTNNRGYLNGWIDGLRDGNWAGSRECAGGGFALEHFIVDHGIDVTGLGPGYHTIQVPTQRVLWPADLAQQPAWVRLTLSERPSAKTATVGNLPVGDGRGHAIPFRLGETEDYLLRPPETETFANELAISMDGDWSWLVFSQADTAFTFQKIELAWLMTYANRGSRTVENAVLTFDVPEGLRGQDALIDKIPEILRSNLRIEERQIAVRVGRLEPGQEGRLLLRFRPEIDDEVIGGWTATAKLVEELGDDMWAAGDNHAANATASFKVEIEGVTQGAFGFRSPDMDWLVQRGTTNSRSLTLQGFYQERIANEATLVKLWVHSVMVGMGQKDALASADPIIVPVGADGRWSHTLTDLPDGFYQFAVGDPAACDASARTLAGNDNEWRRQHLLHGYGTVCGLAVVDGSLAVNPISLRFVAVDRDNFNQLRRLPQPDTLNWALGEWRVAFNGGHIEEDIFYVMSLRGRPGAKISWTALAGDEIYLTELEEISPGYFEATVRFGDGSVRPAACCVGAAQFAADGAIAAGLQVDSDGIDVQYDGLLQVAASGQVRNRATGAAVAGATVTLLAATPSRNHVVYTPWQGGDQPNPVTTDAAGRYALAAPTGVYQLVAIAPGYQPYRAAEEALDGLVNQEIRLTAAHAGEPDALIAITDRGFEPALLNVKPGRVIAFVNATVGTQRVTHAAWDSGLLLTGERYVIRIDEPGTYTLASADDPSVGVAIVVDPNAVETPGPGDDSGPGDGPATSGPLYLPSLRR